MRQVWGLGIGPREWVLLDMHDESQSFYTLDFYLRNPGIIACMHKTQMHNAVSVAARGCLPRRRQRQSDQFCNQGIFQDLGHRGVNQLLGSALLPKLLIPLSSPMPSRPPILLPFPFPPLKVGPLNPTKRSGRAL